MSNVGIENEFSEDDNDIRELAERFAARRVRERVREIDQTDIFPLELYREAAELGLVSVAARCLNSRLLSPLRRSLPRGLLSPTVYLCRS